jgi:hypothetical protein
MEGSEPRLLLRRQPTADDDEVTVAVEVGTADGERPHQIRTDEVPSEDAGGTRHQDLEEPVELRVLRRFRPERRLVHRDRPWGDRGDSNPRPSGPQPDALTT